MSAKYGADQLTSRTTDNGRTAFCAVVAVSINNRNKDGEKIDRGRSVLIETEHLFWKTGVCTPPPIAITRITCEAQKINKNVCCAQTTEKGET